VLREIVQLLEDIAETF